MPRALHQWGLLYPWRTHQAHQTCQQGHQHGTEWTLVLWVRCGEYRVPSLSPGICKSRNVMDSVPLGPQSWNIHYLANVPSAAKGSTPCSCPRPHMTKPRSRTSAPTFLSQPLSWISKKLLRVSRVGKKDQRKGKENVNRTHYLLGAMPRGPG